MSKKIVIGNWKMNPVSLKEAKKLFLSILSFKNIKKTEIVLCPPFVYLEKLKKINKKIKVGAQDVFWEKEGAFTGEISAEMLYDLGIRHVIIGHSERRNLGENNKDINKKIKMSLFAGLTVILCIGEELKDEKHEYLSFIKTQIEECLAGISKSSLSKIIIAYEPVWAIGKGAFSATSEEFREMSIFIRKILSDKFGMRAMEDVKIIYGGSVDTKNVKDFIDIGLADGFLIGRASLDSKKFINILKICEN